MNKLILCFALSLFLFCGKSNAQMTSEQITEKYGIKDEWSIEDNGSLSFCRIIMAKDTTLSQSEMFDKVMAYFNYNYTNGKNVIQSSDKESGYIIGKGLFVISDAAGLNNSVEHLIKVDFKNGRARIIITVDSYLEYGSLYPGGWGETYEKNVVITSTYPFVKFNQRTEKLTKTEKIHNDFFEKLIKITEMSFDEIESTINVGSSVFDSKEW